MIATAFLHLSFLSVRFRLIIPAWGEREGSEPLWIQRDQMMHRPMEHDDKER
jgi:hypothetical protein